MIKSRNVPYRIFCGVGGGGEWTQNVLESSHLNTKKETGAY